MSTLADGICQKVVVSAAVWPIGQISAYAGYHRIDALIGCASLLRVKVADHARRDLRPRGWRRRILAGHAASGMRRCAGTLRGNADHRNGAFSAETKRLIVANHVSWLDIPVLGSLEPISFLAKKEIGDHPAGRQIVAMQCVIYLDRRRRSCIPSVNARIVEAMCRRSPGCVVSRSHHGRREPPQALPFVAF
jgi:hypothetical protein